MALHFKNSLTLLLPILGFLGACAPKVESLPVQTVVPKLGPRNTDTKVEFNREFSTTEPTQIVWDKVVDTVDLFNAAEDLILAGKSLKSEALESIGYRISNSFYATKGNTTEVDLKNSPFLEAAIKEVGPTIQERLNSLSKSLETEGLKISTALQSLPPTNVDQAISPANLSQFVAQQISLMNAYLKASNIEPLITSAIDAEMVESTLPMLANAAKAGEKIENSKSFSDSLLALHEMLSIYEFVPDAETQGKLNDADRVAILIDSMDTEQEALTVIIEFWRMMTPEERKQNIGSVSSSLYDYLESRSEKQLRCLASDSCSRLISNIAKSKIFSELRKIGIPSLKETFNRGAKEALVKTVSLAATESCKTLNLTFAERINKTLMEKIAELSSISGDLRGFAVARFTEWSKANLFYSSNQLLKGAEYEKVNVHIQGKRISILPIPQNKDTGPAALGSAMSLAGLRWNFIPVTGNGNIAERNRTLMQNTLEQINKMLALIGYSGPNSNQFPPYLISLGDDKNPIRFDADDIFSRATGAAIPDRVKIRTGFIPEAATTDKNISVKSQAELLRGVSRMLQNFRDWETSSYDEGLGSVTLSEMGIGGLPEELAIEKVFPKSSIFTMAVGNAALVLHNLSKDLSPIFVVDGIGNLTWADQMDKLAEGKSSAAMAGIVDIKDGKRSTTVKAQDVARYILALTEFYKSTQGIENTQSEILQNADSSTNKSPVDVLVEARPKIKSLIIGLSNFLTHQLQDKDGGIISSYEIISDESADRNTRAKESAAAKALNDQALAIKALVAASDLLRTPIYKWSALDVYYFMNKNLWNAKSEFYSESQGSEGELFLNRMATLQCLSLIKPLLKGSSAEQLERILEINISKIKNSI